MKIDFNCEFLSSAGKFPAPPVAALPENLKGNFQQEILNWFAGNFSKRIFNSHLCFL